jgi:mRNA-degrading endonuclease RelE of RelBE toxin-antitoxin system
MPTVRFSPEGLHSFGKLPTRVLEKFNGALSVLVTSGPRRSGLDLHPLTGGRGLWTLRIGSYRGIFHWDGQEARFIRFGHRR